MKVTLTFDNGPSPEGTTDQVLKLLDARGIKATFFVTGQQIRRPGGRVLAERAHAEGHWIGNHTFSHTVIFGDNGTPESPRDEIGVTQDLLDGLVHRDKFFRPYGGGGIIGPKLLSPHAVDYLTAGGFSMVLWNSVPRDWEGDAAWIDRCIDDVQRKDWSVVVVHDLPTGAMDHLPRLLDRLDEIGAEHVQDFPASCVPIRRGAIQADISGMVTLPLVHHA
ncbi:polysaccharide deacetylase family protein [Novosphingobium sp. G106]|uniref:polysaccharide deacetylase family protein n=1 Tax=Novosphingobium sp. G106 TaxID=2849500 RepID=UPI001C2D4B42|nr:polysaccharide deacetylase family protein [Novosphingobium sp. G106]MBV1686264.1 polysaccharide deacetylase family protein [Novosphingobium sp. G106]